MFWRIASDVEGAEAKCEESVQKAVAADPSNPEAHQLLASFLLSKDRKDVSAEFFPLTNSPMFRYIWLIGDCLFSAILCSLEQTQCAHMWFYMSD